MPQVIDMIGSDSAFIDTQSEICVVEQRALRKFSKRSVYHRYTLNSVSTEWDQELDLRYVERLEARY
jgi:hypothetical protein